MSTVHSINGWLLDRIECQMQWTDELWSPVGQQRRYSLSGRVHTTENIRYGRPITLNAELPWCALRKATIEWLSELASQPGIRFPLVFNDGTTFMVYFNRSGNPIDFTAINPLNEWYSGTLYLIEA